MTDILLATIVLELGGILYLMVRFRAKGSILGKKIINSLSEHNSSSSEVSVFDASGTFRFKRPVGHPDLQEIQQEYKDKRYVGWRLE